MPSASARIITSLNLKGGVGKTHLCWLIASVCQERQKRCLVLDLDKQANISSTLGVDRDNRQGMEAFFNSALDPIPSDLVQKTPFAYIDAIPASLHLERFNIAHPQEWESSSLHLSLVDALGELAAFYDYILLDCPADISLITYAALCASDFLMIPLEAAQWGALGTQHVVKAYDHVRKQFNSRLRLLGYVVSRYKQRRTYQATYLAKIRERLGADAFQTVIPDYAPFEQSVNDRIPITLHSPSSHASAIARRFFDCHWAR